MTETLRPSLPDELDDRAEALMRRLCERELKLASAESCTGGLLASLFTDIDGAGHAFDRGFVTYTDESKSDLLGIPLALIKDANAVSEPVARAMAEGALARAQADLAISVTGYAGPGGDDAEEGLVHFAVARLGAQTAHRCMHYGPIGRGGVRVASVATAVEMLEEAIRA